MLERIDEHAVQHDGAHALVDRNPPPGDYDALHVPATGQATGKRLKVHRRQLRGVLGKDHPHQHGPIPAPGRRGQQDCGR